MAITVRPIAAQDQARWRELFIAYCDFYEWKPAEGMIAYTWDRIMDPAKAVYACVAVDEQGQIAGFSNYLLHENTTALTPICYLQDLYVDPVVRAGGIGGALIDWLVAEMHKHDWSRLYWNTRETNYRARGLYDKYTKESGFIRYVLSNAEVDKARFA